MFKLKNSLIALFGLILMVGAIAVITPRAIVGQKAAAQPSPLPPPQNVNVINTPLPVTGTIDVGNLGNNPLPVRDLNNPERQHVEVEAVVDFENGKSSVFGSISIPVHKRFIIEHVSTLAEVAPSVALSAGYQTHPHSASDPTSLLQVDHNVVLTYQGTGINETNLCGGSALTYASDQSAHGVVEPENKVTAVAHRSTTTGCGRVVMTFSGYLVDVP